MKPPCLLIREARICDMYRSTSDMYFPPYLFPVSESFGSHTMLSSSWSGSRSYTCRSEMVCSYSWRSNSLWYDSSFRGTVYLSVNWDWIQDYSHKQVGFLKEQFYRLRRVYYRWRFYVLPGLRKRLIDRFCGE